MSQQWTQYRGSHPQDSPGGWQSPNQDYSNRGSYQQHTAYPSYGNQPPYGQQQLHNSYNHPVNAQRPHQGVPSSMNHRPTQYGAQPVNHNYYQPQHYGAPLQQQNYHPPMYQHTQAGQYQQLPYGQPVQQPQQYMQQQPREASMVQQPAFLTPQQIQEQQQQHQMQQVRGKSTAAQPLPQSPVLPVHKDPSPQEQFPVLPVHKPPPQQQQRPTERKEETARSKAEAPQYDDYIPRSERTRPNFPEFVMQYTHFQKNGDIQGEEVKKTINRSHLLITNDAILLDKDNNTNRTFVTFCKWNPLHVLNVMEIANHEKTCIDKDIIEQLKNL